MINLLRVGVSSRWLLGDGLVGEEEKREKEEKREEEEDVQLSHLMDLLIRQLRYIHIFEEGADWTRRLQEGADWSASTINYLVVYNTI